jgi:hypothetical protein
MTFHTGWHEGCISTCKTILLHTKKNIKNRINNEAFAKRPLAGKWAVCHGETAETNQKTSAQQSSRPWKFKADKDTFSHP